MYEPKPEVLEKVKKELIEAFPTARPRLIQIFIDTIDLHARKNNDYNGNMDLYRATGVVGRFCDIWRKVIRMFNAIILETKLVVDENLKETGKDMMVYDALLVEELEIEERKQNERV